MDSSILRIKMARILSFSLRQRAKNAAESYEVASPCVCALVISLPRGQIFLDAAGWEAPASLSPTSPPAPESHVPRSTVSSTGNIFYSALDGILIHRRVTHPTTYLYCSLYTPAYRIWVKRAIGVQEPALGTKNETSDQLSAVTTCHATPLLLFQTIRIMGTYFSILLAISLPVLSVAYYCWKHRQVIRIPEHFEQVGHVSGLFVYPVKSCAGISLTTAKCLTAGIEFDRFVYLFVYNFIIRHLCNNWGTCLIVRYTVCALVFAC